jgi:DNA-binding transcriptional ArsR family regulator
MKDAECCESTVIHEDVLQRVRASLPAVEPVERVAELFKVFGDMTRSRIICALNLEEMCVCDLSALLEMQQSAISHQLRILKDARLVKARKAGRVVYYSLDDAHIGQLFSLAFTHVTEEAGQEREVR